MRRIVIACAAMVVLLAVPSSDALAKRAPTRTERAAIATAMEQPAKCMTVYISTVNRVYASFEFRNAKGCAKYGSNGLDILKRTNGQWKDLGGSSDCSPVRGVPKAVYQDLKASWCR